MSISEDMAEAVITAALIRNSCLDVELAEEVAEIAVAACSCYPRPPSCPTCEEPLDSRARCETLDCPLCGVINPCPVEDPLWAEITR